MWFIAGMIVGAAVMFSALWLIASIGETFYTDGV